jgi:PAS domain S-box-containing protein
VALDNLTGLLRDREEELSAIYENVPGIVFYISVEPDGEFRFLSVSRDFLVATGLPRQQIVGSLVRNVIPPPSRDMVLNHYREAILSGQTVRWEEESVYPAGRRYGEVAVTPLYDAGGVATHLIGIVHDITERKIREGHYEFMSRLSPVWTGEADVPTLVRTVTDAITQHLGVNRVTVAALNPDASHVSLDLADASATSAESAHPLQNYLNDDARAGVAAGRSVIVNDVTTDSRTAFASDRYSADGVRALVIMPLLAGAALKAILKVESPHERAWRPDEVLLLRHVAARLWSAIARAHTEDALRRSEERHEFLLRLSDELRPLTDPLEMQNVASRFLGEYLQVNRVSCSDIEGEDFIVRASYANGVAPSAGRGSISALGAALLEAYRSGSPITVDDIRTDPRIREDERARLLTKDIVAFASVVLVKAGQWVCSFCVHNARPRAWTRAEIEIISDVAERTWEAVERARAEAALEASRAEQRDRALREEGEQALRRSHAELEQRTLQLSRLASQLTLAEQHAREQLARTLHDGLQQQLFTASLALERAAKSGSQADQQDMLQKARDEINEAVVAARTLSVNLFPPILHTAGLPVALSWLAKRMQEQYGVVVSVTADPQANPTARDTRILLFEAVRELLFNTVKHARVHRVDVNLAVAPDGTIEILVSDEGIGFDPTVTLHQGHRHELGLGLFSIQERLALLGGHLDIESAPGKGARFRMALPRADLSRLATGGEDAQHLVWQTYEPASGTAKPLRILIADDHAVVRAGLIELLSERSELQVVGEAADGIETISQARVLQPDVVVMDVSMPQMNGIEATREIRGTLPHIRIVGLSTYSDAATEVSMREAGAQAYFSKTENSHRLIDYLLSVLTKTKRASAD